MVASCSKTETGSIWESGVFGGLSLEEILPLPPFSQHTKAGMHTALPLLEEFVTAELKEQSPELCKESPQTCAAGSWRGGEGPSRSRAGAAAEWGRGCLRCHCAFGVYVKARFPGLCRHKQPPDTQTNNQE